MKTKLFVTFLMCWGIAFYHHQIDFGTDLGFEKAMDSTVRSVFFAMVLPPLYYPYIFIHNVFLKLLGKTTFKYPKYGTATFLTNLMVFIGFALSVHLKCEL